MNKIFFGATCIDTTLKNLRRIVSSFSSNSGSVSVVSIPRIEAQVDLWKRTLPNVTPYYAVKCNPEPILLQTLLQNEVNFDCASLREVIEVKKNVNYDQITPDILYAHPMKSKRDLLKSQVNLREKRRRSKRMRKRHVLGIGLKWLA